MLDTLKNRFNEAMVQADFVSLRYVTTTDEALTVRQDVPQPLVNVQDSGAMITVLHQGGMGYAATCDLSVSGLRRAGQQALAWAKATGDQSVFDFRAVADRMARSPQPGKPLEYAGPERVAWTSMSLGDKFDMLLNLSRRLKADDRIVDWDASLWRTAATTILLTSAGGQLVQRNSYLAPHLRATANDKSQTQHRTFGGARGFCRQGGLEVLDDIDFHSAPAQVAAEALELLGAPNCPTDRMDVLLMPDQLILQIHESIGHPLELDRILGDERNYAGTSFVTMDMFGSYRYGSDLLNITFDPTVPVELASYGYDDDGQPAARTHLIEKGILQRPLGGLTSQLRSNMPGVADSRACSWNRPPIDRMANLNLECGDQSLAQMIASIDRGILMKTNCSWSIDDSRNKFQFGCEWAQLIEGGKLAGVVRNPNYRGISATFWRSLKAVGDRSTQAIMGSPYCGKGEPNQMVKVGHATPACVFGDVEVFGGA